MTQKSIKNLVVKNYSKGPEKKHPTNKADVVTMLGHWLY